MHEWVIDLALQRANNHRFAAFAVENFTLN